MKFGLFYELQLPRPWPEDGEHSLFKAGLDQIELADRLGYDYIWQAEHHFLEEYSHSSAPEVFLGAASQRTRQIRLGHGIMHLTTSHPARVAERAATLDLVSDGRLELGVGEGSTTTELHPFGIRFRDKRAVWEDAVRCLIPMLTEPSTEYHGPHWDFPHRAVLPKPLQKPHPPLWVACSQLETIRNAGAWGMGVLGFQFLTADAARAWVSAYYNQFLHHPDRLANYAVNPNLAICSYFMCCATDEEAWEKADGVNFFEFALGLYGKSGPFAPGEIDLWREYEAWKETEKGQARLRWVRENALVGSPDTIRERLAQFEECHIDQVLFLIQAGKTRHEDICASLELFAHKVMGDFHGHEAQHQQWKADVLGGSLVLPDSDTSEFHRQALGASG